MTQIIDNNGGVDPGGFHELTGPDNLISHQIAQTEVYKQQDAIGASSYLLQLGNSFRALAKDHAAQSVQLASQMRWCAQLEERIAELERRNDGLATGLRAALLAAERRQPDEDCGC